MCHRKHTRYELGTFGKDFRNLVPEIPYLLQIRQNGCWMYLHGVEQSKHGVRELLGNWEKNEAEGQNDKEHQGQDSSIAGLTTRRRRCYRIKLVGDGAGGNLGTWPGLLTGIALMQSQQAKGLLLGPCTAHICGTGKM